MSDESWEQLEERLVAASSGAPARLRATVLADVQRELGASRWDRRLARSAAAVLLLGVGWNGLNYAVGPGVAIGPTFGADRVAAADARQDPLVKAAAAVAEATDATTGWNVARQMAALSGRALSAEQTAAIRAALRDHEG